MHHLQFPATPAPVDLICAVLRGEAFDLPDEPEFANEFVSGARYHGVLALLNDKALPEWPQSVREPLRQEAMAQAVWELRHLQLLGQLLERLTQVGVTPVIFKGTALAYGLYGTPALRSRGDTDFIIDTGALEQSRQVLADCGFRRDFAIPGEFVSSEENWSLEGHAIDLHRKICNSAVLARLFTHDELLAASRPLPALSPHARGAGDVHALLIACMHRATHRNVPYYVDGTAHYGGDRLIWLRDIQLLAQRLGDWDEFVSLASAKGLSAICLEALNSAQACLGLNVPDAILIALAQAGEAERPGIYLKAGRLRQAWMDFRSIEGNANKMTFLEEVLFPPRHYMLAKYPQTKFPLPLLYLHRAYAGVISRLSKAESRTRA